jgi:hypothetical protein
MKGYELYSWQADNGWHFTLTTGTNRLKSLDEIIANGSTVTADGWVRISVQGVDSIRNVLRGLPQDEEIFWVDKHWLEQSQVHAGAIMLPPQEIIDAMQDHCRRLGLALHVSNVDAENRE